MGVGVCVLDIEERSKEARSYASKICGPYSSIFL